MSDIPDFEIMGSGMVYVSVCTRLSDEDTTKRVNEEMNIDVPDRAKMEWKISSDKTFASGEPNPCKCQKWPETHRHILYTC